ncbi:hypothetical protein IJG66_01215 [Candidatus Saccharibacteria bacterium]|nr:hypothetical protein [Candidatus Saccharibacteria bacterium]
MDKMAYLQQISGESSRKAKGAKKGLGGLFSGKMMWILIGLVVFAIGLIVLTSVLNGDKTNPELESATRLGARMENLTKTIGTYNKQVKSSGLRAIATSLNGIITNTNRDVSEVLKGDLKAKTDSEKNTVKTVQAEEAANAEDLNNTLEVGRMSGVLDRVYLREMTLQVALLMGLEQEVAGQTSNGTLLTAISDSLTSLENIHTQLKDFTDISI